MVGSLPHSGKSSPPLHAPPCQIRGAFWWRGVSRGVGFGPTIPNIHAFVCVCMLFVYVWSHEIISKNMFVNRYNKILCLPNGIYRFPTSGFGDSRATQLSMQEK